MKRRPREIPAGLLWDHPDPRGPLDPALAPLAGCRPWEQASESVPEPGDVCPTCGAVRDGRGRVVALDLVTADGSSVRVKTGIRPGDLYVCLACQCVAPEIERRLPRCRPRKARERPAPPGRARLSKVERRAMARTPEGRACLALFDARAAHDRDAVARIELAFADYAAGALSLKGLEDRATNTAA